MIDKQLNDITADDLENLRANAVAEGRTLDYKRDLPGNGTDDKKEFLRDVVSFANTQGGDLIFGIEEDKGQGIPKEIIGCDIQGVDELNLKWQNQFRDGIDPPLMNTQIRFVPLDSGQHVVILRIPESWQKPHRVKFKTTATFYARNAAGKYPIELNELRQLMTLSETLAQQVRQFQQERIARVARTLPVRLPNLGAAVLHIVPLNSLRGQVGIDLQALTAFVIRQQRKYYVRGDGTRYNADGFLELFHWQDSLRNPLSSHCRQWFRNGSAEIVETLDVEKSQWEDESIEQIHPQFEVGVLLSARTTLETYLALQIPPPFVLMLSLIDAKGYALNLTTRFGGGVTRYRASYQLDRNVVTSSELLLQDFETNVEWLSKTLKPMFDDIWQAFGESGSRNYTNNGMHNEDYLSNLKRLAGET